VERNPVFGGVAVMMMMGQPAKHADGTERDVDPGVEAFIAL
jgi:hypothetical protein